MAPVTEMVTMTLQTGAAIEDPNSPSGRVWAECHDTISQQPGYQRAYYGRQLENPSLLQLLVDWDSYEAHENFTKDGVYEPFLKHFMTFVDGEIAMHHACFRPHPPSAAVSGTCSPVTEVWTTYLDGRSEEFEENIARFGQIVLDKADGCRALSSGWAMEEVEHESFGPGKKKGNAYVTVIGWDSKEKHMAFRETPDFMDNIHLVRRDEVRGMTMHHVSFVEM